MDTHTDAASYEIRVERHLGPGVAILFPEFMLTEDGGDTVMRGILPDQAALHGVLARIRDLGLTLISVARITDAPIPTDNREDQNP